jgi:copper homeostasis protein
MLLEVCVDNMDGLAAAVAGGADRIELCSALSLGGLTPSAGLMAAAARNVIPAYAMIRPRAGDFVYSAEELAIMRADIDMARRSGLAGVVLGASLPDGSLDRAALTALVSQARDLGKTLHRAVDLVPDIVQAIELAVELGFNRILTSGLARTAAEGIEELERMVALAAGRVSIMPGSGVNPKTVAALVPRLQISEVHASCSVEAAPADCSSLLSLGFANAKERRTDAATVHALKTLLR